MKQTLIVLLCLLFVNAKADNIKVWLKAEGINTAKPVLSNVKNVNDKTFDANKVLMYTTQNIKQFDPQEGRFLLDNKSNPQWNKAEMNDSIVVSSVNKEDKYISYYASYITTDAWSKGTLTVKLFCPAEIYVDGQLKDKHYGEIAEEGVSRKVNLTLTNGKHSVVIKTLNLSDKVFTADFSLNKDYEFANVSFDLSPKRGMTISDIMHGAKPLSVSISPKGEYAYIFYSQFTEGKGKNNYWAEIKRLKDNKLVYTFKGSSAGGIKWMPKGNTISWKQKDGNYYSVYSYNFDNHSVNTVAEGLDKLENFYWAPDASYMIYTVSENYAEKNWVLRKVQGIEDRQSYFRYRTSLYKYDLKTGSRSLLNWGNKSLSLHDISNDADKLIVSTSRPDYSEYPFSKQDVYMLDINTMQLDTLWKDRLQGVSCQFSPDDSKLLVKGSGTAFGKLGLNIKEGQISNGFDYQLYIYDLQTKEAKAITYDFNPNISSSEWHNNGNIYVLAEDKDYKFAFVYDTGKDKWSKIECPGEYLRSLSLTDKGNYATYIGCNANSPYKIQLLNLKNNKAKVIDFTEGDTYKNVETREVKDWNFTMDNGTTITGRYYLPRNFNPDKKYPLLVYYYGGTSPVSRYFGSRYPFNLFADQGYVVYVLQPSGSTGFGQEFAARHQNNWCKITADEIIYGVSKFADDHKFVNKDKMACMGASYGGFTTEYLQTQTDMFACAISHAGISSITSYWGEGYWGYSYSTQASAHSYPWNRKDIYVEQSPLYNADKIKTPMLLLHGTADVNVPTGESIQFYTALKLLGVNVDLVLINGSDHIVLDYHQRIKWSNTILAYLSRFLKDQPQRWNEMYPDKNL